MFVITAVVILFTLLIYKFVVQPAHYWDKLAVRHPSWFNYIYFNFFSSFKQQSVAVLVQELYNSVQDTRLFGCHIMNDPTLVLKDPELIKQVTIKAFDHFSDRFYIFAIAEEPLIGQNLFNLKGQKWREMRSYLSPTFTTNKMKMLFRIMDTCGEKFVQHFLSTEGDIVETDMQNAFTRYTNDVIASSVFGIEVDSLTDPNNEFYLRGREATDFTKPIVGIKFLCSCVAPKLYRLLGLRLLPKATTDFFIKLISDSIKLREEGKIVQNDMMNMLLETKTEYEAQLKEDNITSEGCLTTDEIMAQAFIFFVAGFESVARTMCFMAYELAVNRNIQEKLRSEIEEVSEKCNGKITYDALMGMKYMDMVVSEVLRKYPIQAAVDRICIKQYTLQSDHEGEKPVTIDVGTSISIPTYAIHNDPKYFPKPEIFDPERFSDENKSNIPPYAYHPFGVGPRMCIGSRFALMETKLVYFHLLRKFEILPTETTKIPLVFFKSVFTLTSEFGFFFGLKKSEK